MPVDTYTASGTWVCPSGVTSVDVECLAGGSGGRRPSGGSGGRGGGGGAYSKKVGITVVPGNSYTVTVGAGGAENAFGSDSWFINTSTVLAKASVTVGVGGLASSSIGDTKYNGGSGGIPGMDKLGGGGGGSSDDS